MNLTVDTVVPHLIDLEYLSPAAIVASDLEVIDAGRRNQNLKILNRSGRSLLLKQAGAGEPATERTIRAEAAFYHHCQLSAEFAEVCKVIPKLHHWDKSHCWFLAELIAGETLWAYYGRTPAPEFPSESAAPLGTAIGTVHRVFQGVGCASDAHPWIAELPANPPWVLLAHRPTPAVFTQLSPANRQVLQLIQREPTMVAALESLRIEWKADTIVHNDLKGDNVIVTPTDDGRVGIHLVDWELVQVGDAAWDVGSVLRDFLDYWLLCVPLSGDLTPEEMLEGARIPLENLHPAVRAFWNAYHTAAHLDASELGPFLLRSIRLAAARMAQGAYELSLRERQPSNYAYGMLQIAINILADPRDASLQLFGLSVGRSPG